MELTNFITDQAWPLTILTLGILFRGPISHLINRTEKIEKLGLEAGPATQRKNISGPDQIGYDLKKALDNQLRLEQEDIIRATLSNINSVEEREQILIQYLATAQLNLKFEMIYSWIYGSQIEVLQALNSRGMMGAGEEVIKTFFEIAQSNYSEQYSNFPFEEWLEFLLIASLINKDENSSYHITVLGREFLMFIIKQGRPLAKNL